MGKNLIISALLLFALVLIHCSALAQAVTDTNQLGLFLDEEATIDHINLWPSETTYVYLVIRTPFNVNQDTEVKFLSSVEFRLTLENCYLLTATWPVPTSDAGDGENNFIVNFAEPVQVVDELTTLSTFFILFIGDYYEFGYLELGPAHPAIEPGFMACGDWEFPGDVIPLTPPEGLFGYPTFSINGTVEEEWHALDAVKALYR